MRLLHLPANSRIDLALQFQDLQLAAEHYRKAFQAIPRVQRLQERLLIFDSHRQVRRDLVGKPTRLIQVGQGCYDLRRQPLGQLCVLLELVKRVARKGLQFRPILPIGRLQLHLHHVTRIGIDEIENPRAFFALNHDSDGAVGQPN